MTFEDFLRRLAEEGGDAVPLKWYGVPSGHPQLIVQLADREPMTFEAVGNEVTPVQGGAS